ncbi:MAG: hypothetical protein ABIQ88_15115 [Chitinophagaceae bacterium]
MKKIFPGEFSDLLNRKGLSIYKKEHIINSNEKVTVINNIIKPDYISAIQNKLGLFLYPHLKKLYSPIDPKWMKTTKYNFHDRLGKTMRVKSAVLNTKTSNAFSIASEMGLIQMLNSESFRKMGETIMNLTFGASIGKQLMCYENGDFVSPHTDYLPEHPNLKNGYFDIHLMFSSEHVKHQTLIYEQNGLLNNVINIAASSGVAVYHLPFWHYTTPLITKKNQQLAGRRWLILHSFEEPV